MTKKESLKLLIAIRDLALVPYPWESSPDLVPSVLGQIASLAEDGIRVAQMADEGFQQMMKLPTEPDDEG